MTSQNLHSSPPITHMQAGGGRITLALHGSKAVFEELSSAYPLKLISPKVNEAEVAIVYLMSYGGGLVSGDHVHLEVKLKERSKLVVLSQGSTKVFKKRPGQRLATVRSSRDSLLQSEVSSETDSHTTQVIRYTLAPQSCLFLLPDPVTCFRSASYNQIQTFDLATDSSVVILDWLTSGRKSFAEEWAFARYYSENEIHVDGKRIAKDAMLLEDENDVNCGLLPKRTLGDRLAPYSCYAMVLLYGPKVLHIVHQLETQYKSISVFKMKTPGDLLWSMSPLTIPRGRGRQDDGESTQGAVVRVAGKESEMVKEWLRHALKGVEEVVGAEIYRRAFV